MVTPVYVPSVRGAAHELSHLGESHGYFLIPPTSYSGKR
jgi:hypothetical protein